MLQYFCHTKHCAHCFTFLLCFLSTHVSSLIFVPFHISSSYISFSPPSVSFFLYPLLLSPFWHLTSVHCLTLPSSWRFFSKLFVWSLSFSSFMFTYILFKYYIYMCIHLSPHLQLSSWNKEITHVDSLILFYPFLSTWNTLLLLFLKHMYWVDWRIKYGGNVPKFRSVLKKASFSGCIVNRADVVFPLTVPEEAFKPLELKDIMTFFLHFSISGVL